MSRKESASTGETSFNGMTISMFDQMGFLFAVFDRSQSSFKLKTRLIVFKGFVKSLMESEMERLAVWESKNTSFVKPVSMVQPSACLTKWVFF